MNIVEQKIAIAKQNTAAYAAALYAARQAYNYYIDNSRNIDGDAEQHICNQAFAAYMGKSVSQNAFTASQENALYAAAAALDEAREAL